MFTVTLESGRTYGVLFETPVGEEVQIALHGVGEQAATVLRPDGESQTLAVTEGVITVPAAFMQSESYVQVSAGGAVFGFRAVKPEKAKANAAPPYNLLDNSDFTCPVNQRGKTSYTGKGYTLDRWKSVSEYGTVSIGSPRHLVFSSGGSSNAYLQQHCDVQLFDYAGKQLTLAVCTWDGRIYTACAAYPIKAPEAAVYLSSIALGNGFVRLGCTANHIPYVEITVKGNAQVELRWIALYEGAYDADTLPPYCPKGYVSEFAACRRFFTCIPACVEYAPSDYDATKYFLPMRAVPTATVYSQNGAAGSMSVQSGGAWTDGEATLSVLGEGSVRVQCARGEGVYAFERIELSADF